MTTAAELLHDTRTPCYLGCDAQTTGMAWAAVVVDTGDVAAWGWLPFDKAHTLEDAAQRATEVMARDLVAADLRPAQVAVERVGGGRGVQSMLAVADAAGVVTGLLVARYDFVGFWRPRPAEWKRAAGLSGNAGKVAIRDRAYEIAGEAMADARQDVCDAVCIAWGDRQAAVNAVQALG